MKKSVLDIYLLLPIKQFIEKQSSVGLLLIFSAILAMIFANSPLAESYHSFWKQYIHIGFNDFVLRKNLLHWINDGLMSMFFFLVGLELKREILHGELSNLRDALLPIAAAIGGMVFPALIYFFFNGGTEAISGWGIPMATDIAFALGILYLLGDRIPLSLKVFLTAIAIVDDFGAVIVIALFYTANLSLMSLGVGAFFLVILLIANFLGIRNTLFYALMGIGGLWLAILLSGVHATIAAVLAAFTIPTSKKIDTTLFLRKVRLLSSRIRRIQNDPKIKGEHEKESITNTMEKFSSLTQDATPPLQRLEHALHPFVSFVVLPVFAFANAGVTIDATALGFFTSPVTLGIIFGLIFGKFLGIVILSRLMVFLKICKLPKAVEWEHIYGVGFLAAIGFTMSLFITELAFIDEDYLIQAKIGILSASLVAGIIGFFYLKKFTSSNRGKKTGSSAKTTQSKGPINKNIKTKPSFSE
ncbi:Na+/H+ antiporter NhaA [Salegentibacter sp. F188]|uniref:Na(+)/H(+) antiporter NhaA n=1 Tax=Autumnicola patrickiae TaxID=3075591 RepID=A0ABU3E3W3_9FLAO|nr:Na+/H+ antiporter NhaA [Salegentibacter sp. F188]MDT0690615.1 Na+/H+ antiporter NhaA [Salegentibacter sp. F188]